MASDGDEIPISREHAYQVLDALQQAIDLAIATDAGGVQIVAEDAYGIIRDALMPDLPES